MKTFKRGFRWIVGKFRKNPVGEIGEILTFVGAGGSVLGFAIHQLGLASFFSWVPLGPQELTLVITLGGVGVYVLGVLLCGLGWLIQRRRSARDLF